MDISSPPKLGLVSWAWEILVAIFAVFAAPRLKSRFGTPRTLYVNFALMAAVLPVIGLFPNKSAVVIVAVIVAGAFIGVNNTLVTTAVMSGRAGRKRSRAGRGGRTTRGARPCRQRRLSRAAASEIRQPGAMSGQHGLSFGSRNGTSCRPELCPREVTG